MLTEYGHPKSSLWCRVAGGSLGLTGIGHLATEVLAPKTPEQSAVLATLHTLRVSLPGAERSAQELLTGFSLTMGVLLIGTGTLLAIARPTRSSSVAAAAMTLGISVLAWRYLFVVPGVLTTIAALAALLALRENAAPER